VGGREGALSYTKPAWLAAAKPVAEKKRTPVAIGEPIATAGIDRTAKLYIAGKQARPDGGYSRPIAGPDGTVLGEVGEGNRKDIRNAVEAARAAAKWSSATEHNKAQILYYLAENLDARAAEFADRVAALSGQKKAAARKEVDASIARLFAYGAWADKYEGAIHRPPMRGLALAMNEPVGVIGIACPEEPSLLGFVSLVAPAIAMGNTTVVVPSESQPLLATDFYQVLETSDVPAGVVNIVTGDKRALALELAKHEAVDSIWYFGERAGGEAIEKASTGNLKQTWTEWTVRDWTSAETSEGPDILVKATQVKNIWIPYGE
jgi:aldehyde dehydrogenase (NAD+)